MCRFFSYSCFFFNDTATTEIYTLSLHDALPILSTKRQRNSRPSSATSVQRRSASSHVAEAMRQPKRMSRRSEEHTSELQSRQYLVCRLLLEKKKKTPINSISRYSSYALNNADIT